MNNVSILKKYLSLFAPATMSLLSSLLARTTLDDHEEILKAANEALKKSKTDIQARRTRAVALLKLDRFDDALRAFEDGDGTLRHEAQLEYAYALFKNGKYDEAAKIAKSNSTKRSFRHIESQSNYRLERFGSARECYTRLATQASAGVGEENDLRVNSGATDAQLFWCGLGHLTKKIKADREDLEHFETAFNSACGYIARGEWKQGSTLLTRAKGSKFVFSERLTVNDWWQICVWLQTNYPMKRNEQSCYQY